uniref:hypothetical protein n=1 Tax=Pseudomonas aeruginosa TaxID=287 RepID=UPI0011611E78
MEPINVNPEVRARILSAIEELYDQLGRSDQFPTQAEVRAKAKADMNCGFHADSDTHSTRIRTV